MSRSPELIAALKVWRARFEADPSVTYDQIGEAVQRSGSAVRTYAKEAGWSRPPHIHAEALLYASRKGTDKLRREAAQSAGGLTPGERREACRIEWETDATVTVPMLGERLGMPSGDVWSHAKRRGWKRSPAVKMQAAAIQARKTAENARKATAVLVAGGPVMSKKDRRYPAWDTYQKEREYTPPKRYASVFDYAAQMA
jgi:hypothetical protein